MNASLLLHFNTDTAPGKRRRRPGFTLVEVMVVAGVVAILLAILVPTLSKAREVCRRAACAANLQQLYLITQGYVDTNRGRYFPDGRDLKNRYAPNDLRLSVYNALGYGDPTVSTNAMYTKIWQCPSNPFFYAGTNGGVSYPANDPNKNWPSRNNAFVAGPANADPIGWFQCSYVYLGNGSGLVATGSTDPNYSQRPVRMGLPATTTALFADRVECWNASPYSSPWTVNHGTTKIGANTHAIGANEVFTDGHVAWVNAFPNTLLIGANDKENNDKNAPTTAGWWW